MVAPLMWGAVLAFYGRNAARALFFPLGYLIFAIPVWDYLNPLAQWSSIFVVRFLLRVTGVPAYFDETTVHLPAGTFEIAHGCSGRIVLSRVLVDTRNSHLTSSYPSSACSSNSSLSHSSFCRFKVT